MATVWASETANICAPLEGPDLILSRLTRSFKCTNCNDNHSYPTCNHSYNMPWASRHISSSHNPFFHRRRRSLHSHAFLCLCTRGGWVRCATSLRLALRRSRDKGLRMTVCIPRSGLPSKDIVQTTSRREIFCLLPPAPGLLTD